MLERWASEHGIDWAARARAPSTPRPRRCSTSPPVDPETMGRNGQLLREGAEALGRQPRAAAPKRRPLRPVQLVSERLPARRQARDARLLPAAGGRRRRPRARRGRGAADRLRRRARRRGRLPRRRRRPRAGSARPFTRPRPPRGGARRRRLRHPELLLRSGFRSPSGELGRNLRIHPRLLGRRALRRGGARLGRRDAELRGRRVGGPRRAARGDLHPARLRRCQWLPGTGVEHQERLLALRQRRLDRGPPLRPAPSGRVALGRRRLAADHLPAAARGRRPARRSGSPARPSSSTPPAPARSTRRSRAW